MVSSVLHMQRCINTPESRVPRILNLTNRLNLGFSYISLTYYVARRMNTNKENTVATPFCLNEMNKLPFPTGSRNVG